jgi:single-stranded-DNA-specific exonuclease
VKIAAIGTLADVVPLVGENRVIAHIGLAALSRGPTAPCRALLQECGLAAKTVDSFHVGFIMAPRLNAAGRMGSADAALELLLMRGRDDATRAGAQTLARQLSEENTRRQTEEAAIVTEAKRIVDGDPDVGGHNMLIVSGSGWHRGVIGIVASKLTTRTTSPRWCCRSPTALRTAQAAASPASTCSTRSNRAATCFSSSADTSRPPA